MEQKPRVMLVVGLEPAAAAAAAAAVARFALFPISLALASLLDKCESSEQRVSDRMDGLVLC